MPTLSVPANAMPTPIVLLAHGHCLASQEGQIQTLFARWLDLYLRDIAPGGDGWDEMKAVENRIYAQPAVSAADLAAKFIIATSFGGDIIGWDHNRLAPEIMALAGPKAMIAAEF